MAFTAFLLLLGLMGTVSSSNCPDDCIRTEKYETQYFKHVSDLRDSSIAPWKMINKFENGEYLKTIQYAECQTCKQENMIAKPIYFQISVFKRVRNETGTGYDWCRCPYDLSVGCTCVKKE